MAEKLREFDPARHLKDEEAIALYLDAVMDENPALLTSALGDVARARGVTELANKTGLAREALYRALSADGNPTWDTLRRVLSAYGLQLRVETSATGNGEATEAQSHKAVAA